jgi:hypothetical protein
MVSVFVVLSDEGVLQIVSLLLQSVGMLSLKTANNRKEKSEYLKKRFFLNDKMIMIQLNKFTLLYLNSLYLRYN